MIELKVEEYCQNCPDFYPETFMLDSLRGGVTIVKCEQANRCAALVRYLKKEIEKNANVGT